MEKLKISFYGCLDDERDMIRTLAPGLGVVPVLIGEDVSVSNVGLASGCRCISVGHRGAITRPLLNALKEAGVAFVSTRSVGVDHIDLAAAECLGIQIQNVRYAPGGVADYTLSLMLMALRRGREVILSADRKDFRLCGSRSREMQDLTVGVIGTGRIGEAVIRRLRGFGCRILAFDPHPTAKASYVSLDTLLESSDVVTLHAPLTAQTFHMIGEAQLRKMKISAVLINTARGALVDTAALVDALRAKQLGGAALDVIEGEDTLFYRAHGSDRDISPDMRALMNMPNVLLTPHIAYYTERALHETIQKSMESCLQFAGRDRKGADHNA